MANDARVDELCGAIRLLAQGLGESAVALERSAPSHAAAARRLAQEAERTVERILLGGPEPSPLFPTLSRLK